MKYIIYSNARGIEFEEQVDSLEDPDILEFIEDHLDDEVAEALGGAHHPVLQKAQGFFENTEEIDAELYAYAKSYLQHHLGGKVFVKRIEDDGTVVSSQAIDIASKAIDHRQDCEQSCIDVGAAIIAMLRNFLCAGSWQFGLRRQDGTILTDPSQWPVPLAMAGSVTWHERSEPLEPMIWFGLQDEQPIECWTLDRSTAQFEQSAVYDHPQAKETRLVERWKQFWFCRFWALDWNALFGNGGDTYIFWMFFECGMEEPVDEFLAVRKSCPIALREEDSSEALIRKIETFFVTKQNDVR
ncbi:hypothetical protein [uncultured Thiohalocapsa sp.]|uniref:hypothetical protein n=1 Tax=uncultured Thiohalocapsa sp. TaxID=768990 RepID=UPI0025D4BC9B|nr:hypothetical protein [uncultured Thiohalocapsa sp.]